jgi:heat shock protein HtpX
VPQLWNVVQEMATAANVPMPKVYLIDDTAPNAFATGRDPKHASVAITTGLLQKLDREELQGVMAHELSHVRNFDIRFSLMVGVLVGSIALLADFFLRFTFWGGGRQSRRDSNSSGGGIQMIIFLLAITLAILAPIISRLVQLAVSRQREYLADASGIELTRNPYGLERALAKIALDQEPLEVANRATQHLYFENPMKAAGGSHGLFSTHPPALERVNRLRELSGQPPVPDVRYVLDQNAMAGLAGANERRFV